MIKHSYTNASDNLAQYEADQISRQEVTVDWYIEHMIDAPVFIWVDDEIAALGMDPWRFHYDLPREPEIMKANAERIFVQRKDMPQEFRTVAHNPFAPATAPMTDLDALRYLIQHAENFGPESDDENDPLQVEHDRAVMAAREFCTMIEGRAPVERATAEEMAEFYRGISGT